MDQALEPPDVGSEPGRPASVLLSGGSAGAVDRHHTDLRRVVTGTVGTGKTTFAHKIAAAMRSPHVELDGLALDQRRGRILPAEVYRPRVDRATQRPAWVVDGYYAPVADLTWGRADGIIWLDYPITTKLWWLMRRAARRVRGRKLRGYAPRRGMGAELTSLTHGGASVPWLLRGHRRHRRGWPDRFNRLRGAGTSIWRVDSPPAGAQLLWAFERANGPLVQHAHQAA